MGHDGRQDERTGSGAAILTRRSLLELAGLAFATRAIPPVTAFAETVHNQDESAQAVSPVMDKLSRYMSEARERVLPEDVAEKAKHHVLDTLAAMISGSEIRPGRAAIEFVRAYGGKEVATVVASNIVCGPIEAALANGVLAHADETDDSHGPSRSHPGVSAVPAALAAGEQFGISGKHFLRAVTLGYDIGTRVTMSMGGPGYQVATHRSTHGTVAAFAARVRRPGALRALRPSKCVCCWITVLNKHRELERGAAMRSIWRRLSSLGGGLQRAASLPEC